MFLAPCFESDGPWIYEISVFLKGFDDAERQPLQPISGSYSYGSWHTTQHRYRNAVCGAASICRSQEIAIFLDAAEYSLSTLSSSCM